MGFSISGIEVDNGLGVDLIVGLSCATDSTIFMCAIIIDTQNTVKLVNTILESKTFNSIKIQCDATSIMCV